MAMNSSKGYVSAVALTVAIGGFLLGFDATVISGVVPFIKEYFNLSGASGDLKLGWAVSCLGWGALGGNAVAGFLSDRFGRKKILILTGVLFAGSALLSALATDFTVFVISRVVAGVAVGASILIAPVYIAEIAPAKQRGRLVSFNQLMIVTGISASFFSNYFLLRVGDNAWRWMLGVEAIPSILYILLLFMVPESPRWLWRKGEESRAREILERAAGTDGVAEEIESIRGSFARKESKVSLAGLFSGRMRYVMLIALTIAFFQQITGINAIFYYLPTIFSQAGGGVNAAFKQAVLVGLVNLGMTFVAMWLIDRLGRKPLLVIGATGMAISLLTCAWAFQTASYQVGPRTVALLQEKKAPEDLIASVGTLGEKTFKTEQAYLSAIEEGAGAESTRANRESLISAGLNIRAGLVLFAIIGFVASFAISLGPVMWVLLSEIFPMEYRGAAISIVGFWNSVVSASVTLIFPWELSNFGPGGTFLIFGLFASAAVLFVLMFIPETKGRTLEELETILLSEPRASKPGPARATAKADL
jgi:MFS family permease